MGRPDNAAIEPWLSCTAACMVLSTGKVDASRGRYEVREFDHQQRIGGEVKSMTEGRSGAVVFGKHTNDEIPCERRKGCFAGARGAALGV